MRLTQQRGCLTDLTAKSVAAKAATAATVPMPLHLIMAIALPRFAHKERKSFFILPSDLRMRLCLVLLANTL